MIYYKTTSKGGRLGIISLSEMLLAMLGLLNIIDEVKEQIGLGAPSWLRECQEAN